MPPVTRHAPEAQGGNGMGLLLAVIVWALALFTGYFLFNDRYWMPAGISEIARQIDGQLLLTMMVTGVAFFAAQFLLGWFIFRYRDRGQASAVYLHGNNKIEIGGMLVTAAVFVSVAISGQRIWASVHLTSSPPGAVKIEVTAEQFVWNVRYPGPDGVFGRTAPQFYERIGNTVGVAPDDPAGKDDLTVINNVAVPVGTPVEIVLRSKDVIHSFFMPNVRIKQDAVPGLAVPLRFTATKTGDYEIACAELCGLAHYRMQAFLHVLEPAAYQAWLRDQAAQQ
jgi:cytochrome c oxidase subunit II